jgi:hypothetical protein
VAASAGYHWHQYGVHRGKLHLMLMSQCLNGWKRAIRLMAGSIARFILAAGGKSGALVKLSIYRVG